MAILADVQAAVAAGRYRITRHAEIEMDNDAIAMAELLQATRASELIEDYPTAKPYPACLLLGYAIPGKPIHVVFAYDVSTAHAILVTMYRPDPTLWSPDFRSRVKP